MVKLSCTIKTYLLAGFLGITWTVASAQQNDQLLLQAADAYGQADYQKAIDIYEGILAHGFEAFELYYNLGNAYFKADRIAPAILNYERAAKFDPSNPDLLHNLAMARARTVDKIEMLSVPEFVTAFKSFVNTTPADTWGTFSIISFLLLLGAAAAFLFSAQKWIKQLSIGSGLLLLLLTSVFLYFGWQQQSWLNNRKEAIVFQASATVQSSPDKAASELFVLHEGTKVRIVERFRDWVRIRIGDGKTGWMTKEMLEEI